MSQSATRALAQIHPVSPIDAFWALFGAHPADVLTQISIGSDTLDQIDALLYTIELLSESDIGKPHIKALLALGRYVAADVSNLLDCNHEQFSEKLNAALAKEGA